MKQNCCRAVCSFQCAVRRTERFVGKEDHGVHCVPQPEGDHPGSEEGREAAPDGTGDDHAARRTQRFRAVRDLKQVRLGRGASQGREDGKPRSKAPGRIQAMKGPLLFQFFGSLPPEPPEEDLIQTVRGFFLLPKSSALRKVIVNCQARTVDEHRRRLTGHFRRFLRKAVEDTGGGDGSVSLPDNVLSISECGQDHPAKDAVKAEATLLASAILVRILISGAGICWFLIMFPTK